MPRTPRSEEFVPRTTPSRVSLDSPQTAELQAIGQIGGLLQVEGRRRQSEAERMAAQEKALQDEMQAHEDRLAARELQLEVRLTQKKFDLDMSNAKSDEDIDAIAEERAGYFEKFLDNKKISDNQRDILLADIDAIRRESYIMAKAHKVDNLKKRERSAAESGVELAILDRDFDALRSAVDELEMSGAFESEKQKELFLKKSESEISRSVLNDFSGEINSNRNKEEIDALVGEAISVDGLSDSDKNKLEKIAQYRKNTISREDFSFIGSQISLESGIISRIERGDFFSDEEIDSLNIDESAKSLLKKTGRELQPGLGQNTSDYKNFLNSINDKFAENPIGFVGPKEVSAEQYEKIYKDIDEGPWDTSAKMSLMSHLMKMRAVDAATDRDLFGFLSPVETPDGTVLKIRDETIPIDESQERMLKNASLDLSSKLAIADGKVVAHRTGMTYTDFVDIMFHLQDPKTIAKFKNLTVGSKEFQDVYNQEVTSKIIDASKKTSIQLLRDRILGLRQEQLKTREEISGGR